QSDLRHASAPGPSRPGRSRRRADDAPAFDGHSTTLERRPSVVSRLRQTQLLVLGFLAAAWLSLVAILAVAPEVYDQALKLPPWPPGPGGRRLPGRAHRLPHRAGLWVRPPLALDLLADPHRLPGGRAPRAGLAPRAHRRPARKRASLVRDLPGCRRHRPVRYRPGNASEFSAEWYLGMRLRPFVEDDGAI